MGKTAQQLAHECIVKVAFSGSASSKANTINYLKRISQQLSKRPGERLKSFEDTMSSLFKAHRKNPIASPSPKFKRMLDVGARVDAKTRRMQRAQSGISRRSAGEAASRAHTRESTNMMSESMDRARAMEKALPSDPVAQMEARKEMLKMLQADRVRIDALNAAKPPRPLDLPVYNLPDDSFLGRVHLKHEESRLGRMLGSNLSMVRATADAVKANQRLSQHLRKRSSGMLTSHKQLKIKKRLYDLGDPATVKHLDSLRSGGPLGIKF